MPGVGDVIDNCRAKADYKQVPTNVQRNLEQHIRYSSNTESGTRHKISAWAQFCRITGVEVQHPGAVPWPPAIEVWERYMLEVRKEVTSFPRWKSVIGTVCEVGNRCCNRATGRPIGELDPRQLYQATCDRARSTILREYGQGVLQVEAITQYEALNGPYFCNPYEPLGCAQAVAWCIGCLFGG